VGFKGGWLAVLHSYPSEMAQNFWTAIFAWTVCFVITIVVSLVTAPRPDSELTGLVYSLTKKPADDSKHWFERPATIGVIVLALTVALNIIFY
jgi:SSS family solute:Na+ symporter